VSAIRAAGAPLGPEFVALLPCRPVYDPAHDLDDTIITVRRLAREACRRKERYAGRMAAALVPGDRDGTLRLRRC
jgi:hypothetical protein